MTTKISFSMKLPLEPFGGKRYQMAEFFCEQFDTFEANREAVISQLEQYIEKSMLADIKRLEDAGEKAKKEALPF